MQRKFYLNVISNPGSPHRYWTISADEKDETTLPFHVGFGGITNIQWENRLGEISLIIAPSLRGKGVGEKAVDLLLDKAFNYMNLQTVCGEVYKCNNAGWYFWQGIIKTHKGFSVELVNRKYYGGQFWPGYYFSFDRGDYVK